MAFGACPQCGTRNIRTTAIRGARERLRSFIGVYPFRCRHCNTRFSSAIWNISLWRYARCPKCFRMELSTWSEQYYNPPLTTQLLMRIGATPYRCDRCRCNFVSFRACKERFSWRKQQEKQQQDAKTVAR